MNEEHIIRVAVVDDQPLVRMGIVRILGTDPDLMVGVAASTGDEFLELLRSHTVEVCMLDVNMPGLSALDTLRRLRVEHPDLRVVMFSGHLDVDGDIDYLAEGAVALLGKAATTEEIVATIRAAARR